MWFKGLLGCALVAAANAQTKSQADAIRAVMDESIRQQRESVATQLRSARISSQSQIMLPQAPYANASGPFLTSIPPLCGPMPRESLDPAILNAAQEQNLSPDLLRALIAVESGSVPCSVSPKGAVGLMQLMPGTAQTLGVADPLDPEQNLAGGAKYLSQLLTRYGGDLRLALSAYNAGPAMVDKHGDVPPIPETQRYVREIIRRLGPAPAMVLPLR